MRFTLLTIQMLPMPEETLQHVNLLLVQCMCKLWQPMSLADVALNVLCMLMSLFLQNLMLWSISAGLIEPALNILVVWVGRGTLNC